MPLRALRPCKKVGCIQLTRDASGYCADHLHIAREKQSEQHARYTKSRPDKRETLFYGSGAWDKARAMAMSRDHGLCQHCVRDGRVTLADMVHHIVEIKVNWTLRLTLSNLICLCNRCHAKVSHRR